MADNFIGRFESINRLFDKGDITRDDGTKLLHGLRQDLAKDITNINGSIRRGALTLEQGQQIGKGSEELLNTINAGGFLLSRGRAQEIELLNRSRSGIISDDTRTEDDFKKENVNSLAFLQGKSLREFGLTTTQQTEEQIETIRTKFFKEEVGVEPGTLGDKAARFRDFFTGTSLDTDESTTLPFANSLINPIKLPGFLLSDAEGKMDILLKTDPKTTFRFDSGNNIIATLSDGREGIVQKSGFSEQDVAELALTAVPFVGVAAKIGTGGRLLLRAGKQALGAAAVDVGLQATQIAAGRERPLDPTEVAIFGTLGGAGEVIAPLAQRATAIVRAFRKQTIAPEAAALIKAGESLDIPIVTSDVIQPTTKVGRAIRSTRERLSLASTLSGVRRRQTQAVKTLLSRDAKDFTKFENESFAAYGNFISAKAKLANAIDDGLDKQIISNLRIELRGATKIATKSSEDLVRLLNFPDKVKSGKLTEGILEVLRLENTELGTVISQLSLNGKSNVRALILERALKASKQLATKPKAGVVGTEFKEAIDVFDSIISGPLVQKMFPGKHRTAVEGVRILLNLGKTFAETGATPTARELGKAIAPIAAEAALPVVTAFFGNLLGGVGSIVATRQLSKLYESKIVRNYLLRVVAAEKKGPKALTDFIIKSTPAVNAFLLQQKQKQIEEKI